MGAFNIYFFSASEERKRSRWASRIGRIGGSVNGGFATRSTPFSSTCRAMAISSLTALQWLIPPHANTAAPTQCTMDCAPTLALGEGFTFHVSRFVCEV